MKEKKRILIIDDDQAHLVSTRGLLENEGYEVFTHDNPFGSTNLLRALRPHLVLLDVNMPGLSGPRLVPVLQTHTSERKVPIVLYSSNDEDALAMSARELGLAGYIPKGSPASLRMKVAWLLERARA